MSTNVVLPPPDGLRPDGTLWGGWWHSAPDGERIVCDLCPRECHLKPGDRGFCFVRQNVDGRMVLSTYGRSTGFCIDPIEKKPLNHFYPGTSVLSFGTAGCNLGCKFCQNWDISKSREVERLSDQASPLAIARAAQQAGARSVAFTYNDPVIWAEYAIDTARACRELDVRTVAVTAGYISPAAREPFFSVMDAANVDLKGFTEEFYYKVTYSHLQPVLETLEWLHRETNVWLEITNLVIPRTNDAPDDLRRMCDWILQHCGDETPVHFTAFHPDFRMLDTPPTPHATLLEAYEIGRRAGLKYVYTGNVDDPVHQSTYCPHCNRRVIERNWYALGEYRLAGDVCQHCGGRIAGRFDERPGDWGRKRLPVKIPPVTDSPVVVAPPAAPAPSLVTLAGPNAGPGAESKAPSPSPRPLENARMTSAPDSEAQTRRSPPLSDAQRSAVLAAANELVAAAVQERRPRIGDPSLEGASTLTVMGAFVTLKRQGRLRACCGFLGRPMPLGEALREAALRTAKEDHRLPPISPTELPFLDLDVSLLYDFRDVTARGAERVAAVEVGRHGLQIQRGDSAGLLLPSVPVENGWDSETFLRQVCRKANLPSTAWDDPNARLVTFESLALGGPFQAERLSAGRAEAEPPCDSAGVRRLAEHARRNLIALVEGGTPNYYLFDAPDATVVGLALTVRTPGASAPLQLGQLAFRPGVPLQATLSRLCDTAARALAVSNVFGERLDGVAAGVAVLSDPAMHGTVAAPDLRGVETDRRAIVVFEGGRSVWAFDPQASPDALLRLAVDRLGPFDAAAASVFSLAIVSSEPSLLLDTSPSGTRGADVREPAVAGAFYPDDPQQLNRLVDEQLGEAPSRLEAWPAVLAPHAGLVYSGRLAAAVFRRVEFPPQVIVIGPKHTRHGLPWAVAPHAEWKLPGARIASDRELARQLVEAIPGLQFDAAAHAQEHAIEVELPFLARLAPHSRVVGVVLGGGDLPSLRRFAAGLADVVRRQATPPLLVVSSDMNHFASDAETRRLDELALAALESLDPARLLETCRAHDISMCGVLPAVVVMETLRLLGGLRQVERVGYATSADVTGDTRRVVGYAGLLLR